MFTQAVTRALSRLGLDQRGTDPHPRQPAPMLLQKAGILYAASDWTYEPKWDGFRVVASEGTLTLVTEGQGEKVFGPGQAFVESINTWHTGFNRGTTPLKLLAVFVGEEGTPIRINP